jgi:hypothetical protein
MEKKKKNGDGVSDAEVENVMKLLMAYKEARSQGLAPLNPQLQDILAAMEENNRLLHEDAADITIPSTATKGATDRTSDELVPKPFFVVKTKNEKKQKVFINVCGSHKVCIPIIKSFVLGWVASTVVLDVWFNLRYGIHVL